MSEVFVHQPTQCMNGPQRVVAAEITVGKQVHKVWYRSSEFPLQDGSDAFLAIALLPAMRAGLPLRVAGRVSRRLLDGQAQIQEVFHHWDPGFKVVAVEAEACRRADSADGVGCFFTAGVDSFYSVLRHRHEISKLILVHGFDFSLTDLRLRNTIATGIRAAAAEFGKPLIEVETNLREFSDRYVGWELFHGAALASVVLLLSQQFRKIYVPASLTYADNFAWGSHPMVDHLWGTETTAILQDGCDATRVEKVAKITSDPVALRFLRVCWKNLDGKYNCGRCEKCLRTMAALQVSDALGSCRTFDRPIDLDALASQPIQNVRMRRFFVENLRAAEKSGRHPQLVRALSECLARQVLE